MKKIDIFEKLRSSGLRPTKQRVEIAKFLFDRDTTFHFTIESLENHLTKKTTCITSVQATADNPPYKEYAAAKRDNPIIE